MARAESGRRVVVQIGSGQPELQAALYTLPARARAERLRQLALVGLYSLRFGPASAVNGAESVKGQECVLAVAVLLFVGPMQSDALDFSGTPWETVAKRHGLDPVLLYAVAIQATARPSGPGAVSPWPWTLRTQDGSRFYESREAALADLRAMAEKTDDLDVGLMQVSLKHHDQHFGNPATLLDARINLVVAAGILANAIDSSGGDLALGIGRYRYPSDDRAARTFGQRILRLRDAIGGATIHTRLQQVHAELFAALYERYAGSELTRRLDGRAVISAHDLYESMVAQEPLLDFNAAWVIARDILVGTSELRFCSVCELSYLVSNDSRLAPTCPFCSLYSRRRGNSEPRLAFPPWLGALSPDAEEVAQTWSAG